MKTKVKFKYEASYYGPEGPRNFGILFRMNRIGFLAVFWKWYFDFSVIISRT
jgi:hypothetical protein